MQHLIANTAYQSLSYILYAMCDFALPKIYFSQINLKSLLESAVIVRDTSATLSARMFFTDVHFNLAEFTFCALSTFTSAIEKKTSILLCLKVY